MDKLQGKLICFEGIDGSGKTTQIEFLRQYLAAQGVTLQVEVISFPQYGKNEYAIQIKNYLEGKLGEVDPYELAKVYANDRKTVREQILEWLENGKLVIANRYVSSSKAHLGASLPDDKRQEFTRWIDKLEYEEKGMPKPDLTILLKVDPRIGQKNALDKTKPDIHEKNLEHEQKAARIYLELSQNEPDWVIVDCMDGGRMKSPQEIHQEITNILYTKLPT